MTWLPNVGGRPLDLVNPRPEEVDFAAMAHALAHLNRSIGHPRTPVSVGQHLLVGLDIAEPPLRPLWLLHDGHEERTGDVATPVKEALEAIAWEVADDDATSRLIAEGIRLARREFERRHDVAIHAAAGLALPTAAQAAAIKTVDLRALATERRDFYAPSFRRWHESVETAIPSRRVWKWRPPDRIADDLLIAFRTYLPALQTRRT